VGQTPLNTVFQPLTDLYEPSAIQQLADGRFLVVEDEQKYPFSLVTIDVAGVRSAPLLPPVETDCSAAWKLDDLEALTLDQAGYVYALTSHSRDGAGDEKKSRDKLVRFRIEGDRMMEPRLVRGLKPALAAAHPLLAVAAEMRDVKGQGGLNIEALEFSPSGQLLIGFRSPLAGRRAIIASVDNIATLFEADAVPRIAPALITLDLDGNGIRSLAYVPALNGYLLMSGPVAREQVQFGLWFWSGRQDAMARRISVAGLPGFEHAEGICPAVIDGHQRIMIVSDDGSRKEGRYARYLLLDLEQLQIAP
jgi:hypothetical protein